MSDELAEMYEKRARDEMSAANNEYRQGGINASKLHAQNATTFAMLAVSARLAPSVEASDMPAPVHAVADPIEWTPPPLEPEWEDITEEFVGGRWVRVDPLTLDPGVHHQIRTLRSATS